MLVITKSTRVVPSGCSGPLGIRSSSRMGRWVELPGLTELGNGPRPRAGGEGCFEASIVSWSCASPTRIRPGLSSTRSEEHTSELQSRLHLVCRLLLEKKKAADTG